MTWFYLSILSALSFAFFNTLSRVVALKSNNPRALSVIFNLTAILITIFIFLITGGYRNFVLPNEPIAYLYVFAASLFFGLFERLRFYASKLVEASFLAIINNISVVVAFIIAVFIYSEPITNQKILGFLLILISLLLVSINKVKKISIKGLTIALISYFLVGIAWAFDKKGVYYFNSDTYNVLAWTVPFIFLYFFPTIKLSEIKKEVKIFSWKIILLALINVIAYFLNLKAQVLGEATKVMPIVQISTVITVMFGAFFLNEKDHLFKKIISAIIAIIGVYLLV